MNWYNFSISFINTFIGIWKVVNHIRDAKASEQLFSIRWYIYIIHLVCLSIIKVDNEGLLATYTT